MKSSIPVRGGGVSVRGVMFPEKVIRSAMLETGGNVVSQDDINAELDKAVLAYQVNKGTKELPKALIIEAFPGIMFVPRRVRLHHGVPGTASFDVGGKESWLCLFFAVKRKY